MDRCNICGQYISYTRSICLSCYKWYQTFLYNYWKGYV